MEFGRVIWLDHNAELVAYKKQATLSTGEYVQCSCLRDLFPDSGPNLNIIQDRILLMSNQAHIWPGSQLLLSPLRLMKTIIYQSLPKMCPVSIDGMYCGAALLVRIQILIPIHDHHYTFWSILSILSILCDVIELRNEAVSVLWGSCLGIFRTAGSSKKWSTPTVPRHSSEATMFALRSSCPGWWAGTTLDLYFSRCFVAQPDVGSTMSLWWKVRKDSCREVVIRATAATKNRNNTESTTIANSGKEESENNNVLFSSERASQSL